MKKTITGIVLLFTGIVLISSSPKVKEPVAYISAYKGKITGFRESQLDLLESIQRCSSLTGSERSLIINKIRETRLSLKELDFWLRYLEPTTYKKINGPLPVEWETEVFEKYEAPYKREGAGLTLAENYLDEKDPVKDSLLSLVRRSLVATNVFLQDSITRNLGTYHHFFLANRLFLLNLASIYTTGFECPDTTRIIPELNHMLISVRDLYSTFNQNFPAWKMNAAYLDLYDKAINFAGEQQGSFSQFDQYRFIRDFINPLYRLNHQMILDYNVRSSSFNDYTLNRQAASIFDKSLYQGQNAKGIYIGIDDPAQLNEIKEIGKLLFYDPILSGNNKRSCASCHKPTESFTDTSTTTSLQFNRETAVARNTPTLLNVIHNHLLMLDGKHISLENQARDVITNPLEMGGKEEEVLKKVMSCDDYKTVFKKYLKATPQYKSVNLEHIASALILYYSDLSSYYSPFDHAMNEQKPLNSDEKNGFNLFMSKAQCGTCHFVPQFNGTKPPFVGSEFEVIGVPADTSFHTLSTDKGRFVINPAKETMAAFRTGSLRNSAVTKPYMHNGVFRTLEEVLDFYDAGGGAGKGLIVTNQTVSADSLRLTKKEKKDIISFIHSLNEEIPLQAPPAGLPASRNRELNNRIVGGEY